MATKLKIKRLKMICLSGVLTLSVLACGNNGENGENGENFKIQGRQKLVAGNNSLEAAVFRQQCAVCHGTEAHGKTLGERVVPSLRYGKPANDSDDELYRQIAAGGNGMPAFQSVLKDEQIRAMVAFIRRDLQGK